MIPDRELFLSDMRRFQRMYSSDALPERLAEYVDQNFIGKMEYVEIPHKIAPEKIIEVVCEYFIVKFSDIERKTRARKVVAVRRMLMTLLYERTMLSLADVGRMFHMDHTTVIHNRQKLKDLMDVYPDIREEFYYLNSKL